MILLAYLELNDFNKAKAVYGRGRSIGRYSGLLREELGANPSTSELRFWAHSQLGIDYCSHGGKGTSKVKGNVKGNGKGDKFAAPAGRSDGLVDLKALPVAVRRDLSRPKWRNDFHNRKKVHQRHSLPRSSFWRSEVPEQ